MDLLGNILGNMETPPEVEERKRTREMEQLWVKRSKVMEERLAVEREEEKKKSRESRQSQAASATKSDVTEDVDYYSNYNFGTYMGGYAVQDPVHHALQKMKAGITMPPPPPPPPPRPQPSSLQGQGQQGKAMADNVKMPPPPPPLPQFFTSANSGGAVNSGSILGTPPPQQETGQRGKVASDSILGAPPTRLKAGGDGAAFDASDALGQFRNRKQMHETQQKQHQSFVQSGMLWFDKPPPPLPGSRTDSILGDPPNLPPPPLPSFFYGQGQGLGYTPLPSVPVLADPSNSVPVLADPGSGGMFVVANRAPKLASFADDIELDDEDDKNKKKDPKEIPALLDITVELPRKVPMHLAWRWQQEGRGICIPPPLDMDIPPLRGKGPRKNDQKIEEGDKDGASSQEKQASNSDDDMEICETGNSKIEGADVNSLVLDQSGTETVPQNSDNNSTNDDSEKTTGKTDDLETKPQTNMAKKSGSEDSKPKSEKQSILDEQKALMERLFSGEADAGIETVDIVDKPEPAKKQNSNQKGRKGEKRSILDEQKALMEQLFSGNTDAGVETVEVEIPAPKPRIKTKKDHQLDEQRRMMEQLFSGQQSAEDPFVLLEEKKKYEHRYKEASQVQKLQDKPMNLEEQMLALRKQQVMLTMEDGQEPPSMMDVMKYQDSNSDMVMTMLKTKREKYLPEEKKEKRDKWNQDKQGHLTMDVLTRKVKAIIHILNTTEHRSSAVETINAAAKAAEVKLDIYRVYQKVDFGGKKRFKCSLFLDNLKIAESVGNQKKHSRFNAYKLALTTLKTGELSKIVNKQKRGLPSAADMQKLGMELECPGQGLMRESNASNIPNHPINKGWNINKPLTDFVILRKKHLNMETGEGPAAILKQSADFSHCLLEFEYETERVAPPAGPKLVPKKPRIDQMPPPLQPPPQMYNTPIWHKWVQDKMEWEKKWQEMSRVYKEYEKNYPWLVAQEKEKSRRMKEAAKEFEWQRGSGSGSGTYAPKHQWGGAQTNVPDPTTVALPEQINLYKCTCYVEGKRMGYAENYEKQRAKAYASNEALAHLFKNNWTVMIKSTNPNDLCVLKKKDVLNWVPTLPQSVAADGATGSSVALSMMAKMGWSGGSLGTSENEGMASALEPGPNNALTKRGIGNTLQNRVSPELWNKLEELLEYYAQCSTIDEIVFPGLEFSADEKKAVIQIANKYGLKTNGTEYNKMNYLIIGRKFTGADLVTFLGQHGNCNNKYVLMKPGTFQVEKLDTAEVK